MGGITTSLVQPPRDILAPSGAPIFGYTTLLLSGNGTNGAQNNTFIDSSPNNYTLTRNGNATQGSFSPFTVQTDAWSAGYFDSLNTRVLVTANTGMNQTGDFTVEGWLYITNLFTSFFAPLLEFGNTNYLKLVYNPTYPNVWTIDRSGVGVLASGTIAIPLNQWHHVALVRRGLLSNNCTLFVNGVQDIQVTHTTSVTVSGTNNPIGGGTNSQFDGYLSNIRYTTRALYTGNFTPPEPPLKSVANTGLLTLQSNRVIDTSGNNTTLTFPAPTNAPFMRPFVKSPISGTYEPTFGAASGYFDGTGDFIDTGNTAVGNFGSGAFTIEAWIYLNTGGTNGIIASNYQDSSNGWTIYRWNTNVITVHFSGDGADITGTISMGTGVWYHVAVSGTPTSPGIRLFVNGVQTGSTYTGAVALDSTNATRIGDGAGLAAGAGFNGYISNFRILKGVAAYTGNFTPPSAPVFASGQASAQAYTSLTNINNAFDASSCSLLVNFANAGIVDSSHKNVIETVGNAQISTVQSRWGGSSLSFDGTGDWLILPHSIDQQFITGNFTVEMWIYRNASAVYGLVGKGTGTTGWLVSLNASNQVVFTFGSTTITSTGTVAQSTWTHIAVVREGVGTNQTKIYISGTNDGTGTVSTNFNQTNVMYVGANRTAGNAFNGYIDDLRITKGLARYTANFTVPNAAFPTK